jgi:hypothetical protein
MFWCVAQHDFCIQAKERNQLTTKPNWASANSRKEYAFHLGFYNNCQEQREL